MDEKQFDKYVDKVVENSVVTEGDRQEFGEQILTLSMYDNGKRIYWRIVVIGVKM